MPGRTVLLLTQVYVPDPAASGQYAAEAARELVRRGHRVVVFTARRGYEDASRRYPAREVLDGAEVVRLPLSSFGKGSTALRVLAWALFLAQCVLHGLFVRDLGVVVAMTSPPLSIVAARVLARLRGAEARWWAMDLWLDLLVSSGRLAPASPLVALERWAVAGAAEVVVLDRFMAARLAAGGRPLATQRVIPPWPLEDHLEPVAHEANPFRTRHGLDGRFVFMLSGNLSVANPVTTLLQAALRLGDDGRVRFLFVGGGLGRREIEEVIERERPPHVLLLPYQPLADLRQSLSAADVHMVSLGDDAVGLVHPCKIYGAMAVARPVLYVGPAPSHVSELLERHGIGWRIPHGDVGAALDALRAILATPPAELRAMGERGYRAVRGELAQSRLCAATCDALAGEATAR